MRTPARIAAAVAAAAGCATAATPPALAADACPNAAARAQQVGGALLPDCRAYEMVSPVDKSGAPIMPTPFGTADGGRVAYQAANAFGGSLSGIKGEFVADRTAGGWVTTPLAMAFPSRHPTPADIPRLDAMSADLTRAVYATDYPFDPQDQGVGNRRVSQSKDLYRREADGTLTWLTPRATLPDTTPTHTEFVGASADVTHVLARTRKPLTAEIPDESAEHLYLHVDGRPIALVDRAPDGTPTPDLFTFFAPRLSPDGTRVLFHTGGNGSSLLWLRDDADDPARARTVDLNDGTSGRRCTSGAQLVSVDDAFTEIVFSCPDQLTDEPLPPAPAVAYYRRGLDDGSIARVAEPGPDAPAAVFTSAAALVPADQNGVDDVYATVEGAPRLISSGTHPAPSQLASVSEDGRSIFFTTFESLVPQDTDGGVRDLYVARVGGGFAVSEPPPGCVLNCQGPAPVPPLLPTVATVTFTGSGTPAPEVRPVVRRMSTAAAKTARGTAASITVKVPAKGRVLVSGSGLQLATKAVSKAGSAKLTVRLSARGARAVRRGSRVRRTATVRFESASGPAQTARVALTFTRAKASTKGGR